MASSMEPEHCSGANSKRKDFQDLQCRKGDKLQLKQQSIVGSREALWQLVLEDTLRFFHRLAIWSR